MSMNCLFLNIFSFMLLNINILCIERQFHTLEQISKNFPMMISNYQKYPVFEFLFRYAEAKSRLCFRQ